MLVRGMTLLKDVPVCVLDGVGSFNQDLKLITPAAMVSSDYLGYALAASKPRLKSMVTIAGHGTGRLDVNHLVSLPVWVPERRTQEWLTERFRLVDSVLRQNRNLRDLKRSYASGLAQQLLTGKKRFPEFQGASWIEVRLGDIFDERAEINRGDLQLLSVTGDRGVVPRDELTKRDTSNPDKSKYKRVAVGDIAYNTMRMWQGVSALSALEGIVSPAYTVAVPGNRIDGRFAKHLFKLPAVVHVFHRHSQGLVDDTLNLKYNHFARIRLRIPSDVAEQRRIADVLDLCDGELALLEQQRDLYARYKRGLMARLLSGEIKVPA